MNFKRTLIALAAGLAAAAASHAGVSAEEAKALGTTLTPWGAEKAGSKDGAIPEYTGGLGPAPASFVKGSGKVVDPFPGDKPVLTITPANMAQYADKLTPGTKELLKRFPTYQLQVYATRRSYPAMSKERVAATLKNATDPECKTVGEGTGIRGCWGGTPFPIPKTGYEAMWNNVLAEQPVAYTFRSESWLVDQGGSSTLTNVSTDYVEYPYWDPKEKPYSESGNYSQRFINITSAPPRDAGQKSMIFYPLDLDRETQRTWVYTTGQRRTRLAPELSYDTPAAQLGGSLNYDELSGGFSGPMDRFDFKLTGKKEMYVPYNNQRLFGLTADKVLGKQHVNPDVLRWELHRVWVIEATRKAGKRHIAAKRTFYIDEDSWKVLGGEASDDSGKIFRVILDHTGPTWEGPGLMDYTSAGEYYDLSKGQYLVVGLQDQKPNGFKDATRISDSQLTPEALAGSGIR